MNYYINMCIAEDLKILSKIRKDWLSARLTFNYDEADRQLSLFSARKKIAYDKLLKEYRQQEVSFNRQQILRMLSI